MKTKIDIKRAIAERNYTVRTFAEKLGMSVVNLRENIIKGNPTIKKLEQVANALDCDVTELFYPIENTSEHHDNILSEPMTESKEKEVPQDAREVLCCPNCGTRFLVTNVPHNVENKNIKEE